MAKILTRVLTGVQKLYRWAPADRGPGEIEIDVPIGLIHDVGPSAALGSGAGPWQNGYFIFTNTQTHVASGVLTVAVNLRNPARVFQGIPDIWDPELQFWILGAMADQSDTSDFGAASIVATQAGDAIGMSPALGPTVPDETIFHANDSLGVAVFQTGAALAANINWPIAMIRRQTGNDPTVTFQSVSDNLGTVVVNLGIKCWLGSRYVSAPGAAL